MPFPCKNGCGAQLEDSGATSTGKNGTIYKVYAELTDVELHVFKKGPTGQIVNHAFDCPKKKPFNQKALDTKHTQVEAGTYYSKGSAAGGEEPKSQREEIKQMAEEKNKIAKEDIDAKLEIARSLLELCAAIRYHADRTGHNITPSEDNFEAVDPDAGA